MNVVDVHLGPDAEFEVTITGGNVVVKLGAATPGLNGDMNITIPLAYYLDKVGEKINNQYATLAFAGLKALLAKT